MHATRSELLSPQPALFYQRSGNEVELFEQADRFGMPVLIKGPTGCGKTRFIQYMAERLGRKLYTVACHDDLTTADLVGRHLIGANGTFWQDGPLTRAVREGAICYLDEVIEARKDITVVLHPLADDRRILPLEATGEELQAAPGFMLVVSYNPGYQHILKSLKPSTRQRFVAMSFDFPPPREECEIVSRESGLAYDRCAALVNLAGSLRAMKGQDLEEGVSTRLLIYCATLIHTGMPILEAARATLVEPLSDDLDVQQGLMEAVKATFG